MLLLAMMFSEVYQLRHVNLCELVFFCFFFAGTATMGSNKQKICLLVYSRTSNPSSIEINILFNNKFTSDVNNATPSHFKRCIPFWSNLNLNLYMQSYFY